MGWMDLPLEARIREGALSARVTPTAPPAATILVPLSPNTQLWLTRRGLEAVAAHVAEHGPVPLFGGVRSPAHEAAVCRANALDALYERQREDLKWDLRDLHELYEAACLRLGLLP